MQTTRGRRSVGSARQAGAVRSQVRWTRAQLSVSIATRARTPIFKVKAAVRTVPKASSPALSDRPRAQTANQVALHQQFAESLVTYVRQENSRLTVPCFVSSVLRANFLAKTVPQRALTVQRGAIQQVQWLRSRAKTVPLVDSQMITRLRCARTAPRAISQHRVKQSSAMLAPAASTQMGHLDGLCVQTAAPVNMAQAVRLVQPSARRALTGRGLGRVYLRAKLAQRD